MGVQKSRKSIRYTKYSLKLKKNFKELSHKTLKLILEKDHFKKTRFFFLRKREDGTSFFINKNISSK
jgi:hypothetical protein